MIFPTLSPPRRSLRPIAWPHGQELEYAQALRRDVAQRFNQGVREVVFPRLERLLGRAERQLRTDDVSDDLTAMVNALRARFFVRTRDAERTARRYLSLVERFHAKTFAETYGEVLAINPLLGAEPWMQRAMKLATQENADLITSIPEDALGTVRRLVNDAVFNGSRPEELAAHLLDRFDITENRAVLIATDQVGKWTGTLQRIRQQDAGIQRYRWSTSNDQRVRPEHVAREGRIYSWDDPPSDGHPGMPIRCRCVAIPEIE